MKFIKPNQSHSFDAISTGMQMGLEHLDSFVHSRTPIKYTIQRAHRCLCVTISCTAGPHEEAEVNPIRCFSLLPKNQSWALFPACAACGLSSVQDRTPSPLPAVLQVASHSANCQRRGRDWHYVRAVHLSVRNHIPGSSQMERMSSSTRSVHGSSRWRALQVSLCS